MIQCRADVEAWAWLSAGVLARRDGCREAAVKAVLEADGGMGGAVEAAATPLARRQGQRCGWGGDRADGLSTNKLQCRMLAK